MTAENQLDSGLSTALKHFCFSAYQLYAERGDHIISKFGGKETGWNGGATISAKTRFDIASVTKVIATASLAARLTQAKVIAVEGTVTKFLPEVKGALGGITLFQLLTHTSGIRGWATVYEQVEPGGFLKWFNANAEKVVEAPPNVKVIYSDLGFLLLGEVLAKAGGAPIDVLFQKEVVEPLHLEGVAYGPVKGNVVATEFCLWRNRLLHGEVFDANAFALGGRAPHAGLFSSAESLAPFAREWLKARRGESKWLTEAVAKRFTTPAVSLHGVKRTLGWDVPSDKGSSAGDLLSRESFGHLGYTGTSLWIDPVANGFILFLTNRVHPSRFDDRIRAIRPAVHDGVARVWQEGASA